MKRKIVMVLM